MKPAISVVIPTFNRPHLLRETVESVLAQTVPPLEVIVVDDGSDKVFEEANSDVSTISDRINVYRLPRNRGSSAARNLGLQKARGDWVLFLDDDDVIGPEMFQSSLAVLGHSDEIGVVCCRSDIFFSADCSPCGANRQGNRDDERVYYENPMGNIGLNRMPASEILRSGLMISTCLVRRGCLGSVRFQEDLTVGEDMVFWLTLAANGVSFRVNPSIQTHIRRHGGNALFRADYGDQKIKFLKRLLSDELIRNTGDLFLVHGWLFVSMAKRGNRECLTHLAFLLRHPLFLPEHMGLYVRLQLQKRRDSLLRQRLASGSGRVDPCNHRP
jgi:glycosyltransferase involved in cell wall biosynthesis